MIIKARIHYRQNEYEDLEFFGDENGGVVTSTYQQHFPGHNWDPVVNEYQVSSAADFISGLIDNGGHAVQVTVTEARD